MPFQAIFFLLTPSACVCVHVVFLFVCSCHLQHTIYRGPRDVARHVMLHEGGVLGLFKGLNATLYRETLGNMAMFGVYELVKQQFVTARVRIGGMGLRAVVPAKSGGCSVLQQRAMALEQHLITSVSHE